ncbi:Sporulation-specific penicillin-binding protein [Jannaschia seosinensis]|uniref:Sporulation-specific penicillin-binding protein n=1 Tax=Jannaschia seosinensis TaxID=313367 RepID=A0A0M7B4W0_9RHOB|nr:penicillin-binding protein 2 [Jannaschia seosinensis]CUH07453.1 Sporulation-specific penicillin-binding protein [Jannaschia seosinensis]
MKRDAQEMSLSSRRITRRALMLGGLKLSVGGAILARMQHLQVEQADEFLLLAEENRIKVRLIAPARGLIYDRNGVVVAGNEQVYRVSMIREDADDVGAVITRLRGLVKLDEDALQRALREMDGRPHQAVTIADRLTWEELSTVAVNMPSLSGITPEVGLSRVYPLGPDYAHVIGYVGRVSERDIEEAETPDPLLQTPQFQIGKIGAEKKLEDLLRGRAGARRVEQNAAGRVMRELGRTESTPGSDVQLTLDAGLQNFTQARLGTESASAVVLDVRNGDVLAAVSSPSYDPNLFVQGISSANYSKLRDNDHRPLHNKIVQGLYPPGSTFKMVPLLAALEAGVMSPNETVYCPGYTTVSGRRFHCWKRGGHGHVDAAKSLRESCDVYYYEVAQRAGIDRMGAMANRLGLGVAHDLHMTSVSEGLIPTRDWKRARYNESWQVGDSINASIGQGFVLASPMQLAVMTARIASGLDVSPRMVRSVDGVAQPPGVTGPLDLNRSLLEQARDGMYQVINARGGTAGRSAFELDGIKWAGKTGTSQVRNITAAERARGVFRNEDLPWERRDHALFVGYAPYDDPRYAVSVVVEHGGGGSAAAAPVARDIMLYALAGGLPPAKAYPAGQREQMEQFLAGLPLNPALRRKPRSTEA